MVIISINSVKTVWTFYLVWEMLIQIFGENVKCIPMVISFWITTKYQKSINWNLLIYHWISNIVNNLKFILLKKKN